MSDEKEFEIMRKNLEISQKSSLPICQDTGFPYFNLEISPEKTRFLPKILDAISAALKRATENGFLRPNSVDPITNENYGFNLGEGLPYVELEWKDREDILCRLLLKGGGSENASGQYSLPMEELGAGRDRAGIVKTVLYHLQKIQGQGCGPGIVGIGIGGDRSLSMKIAKKQLFRPLDDKNPDPQLGELEEKILQMGNELEIGVMGLGKGPTLLGAKAGKAARHPASFFVSVAYLCWVARRDQCLLPIV
jgi:fumarate hydratase class I